MNVRHVCHADMPALAALLNVIIERGGSTAMLMPVSTQDLSEYKACYEGRNAWLLACDSQGLVLGFQYLEPNDGLPDDAADIATFVDVSHTRRGIGTALFKANCALAKKLGYIWINATIRIDNQTGLGFYTARGFRADAEAPALTLPTG